MKKTNEFTETVIGGLQKTIGNLKAENEDLESKINAINSHMMSVDLRVKTFMDINLKLQKDVTKLEKKQESKEFFKEVGTAEEKKFTKSDMKDWLEFMKDGFPTDRSTFNERETELLKEMGCTVRKVRTGKVVSDEVVVIIHF